jgi:MoaA/NifB/PqqE/SkfB family radical SAM enzyme
MKYNDILTLFNKTYSLIPRCIFPTYALIPRQFIFEITYRCNFKCPICQFHPILQNQNHVIPNELTCSQIIDCIKKLPQLSLITLTGGEPLVREDFKEILSESAKIRRIHLITNGSLLDTDTCNFLCNIAIKNPLSFGLVGIDISYYGKLDNGKLLSNAPILGLEKLQKAKKSSGKKFPFINFKMVISEDNISMIRPFYEYASEKGVDICSFLLKTSSSNFYRTKMLQDIDGVKRLSPASPLKLNENEKMQLKVQLDKILQLSKYCKTQLRFSPSVQPDKFYDLLVGTCNYNELCCYAPWSFAAISAYGELFPCSNLSLGSILDHSLKDLWHSERMKQFRKLIKKGLLPNCMRCCYLQTR